MQTKTAVQQGGTKRPRNRKAQIAGAAAELFHRRGYHRVGIDDIAAAVGITGSAVYRHFPGKQALLANAIFEGVGLIDAAIDEASDLDCPPEEALDRLLRAFARLSLERQDLAVLWQRESRHLSEAERERLRTQLDRIAGRFTTLLRAVRSELPPADVNLLAWGALGVLGAPSYHRVTLHRARYEELQWRMAKALCATRTLPRPEPHPATTPPEVEATGRNDHDSEATFTAPTSRREELLAAAIRLFRKHGFQAVSMEDIGAAVGIAGPTIYYHFRSKTDMLSAALTRAGQWEALSRSRALTTATSPRQALELLLSAYVEFVLTHSDLLSVYLTEGHNLPEAERHALGRVQRDNISEWARLLVSVRPELADAEARVLVHGAFGVVNDLARIHRFRARPGLLDDLAKLALEVLLTA